MNEANFTEHDDAPSAMVNPQFWLCLLGTWLAELALFSLFAWWLA